jgi:hypothetical protein
VREARIAGSPAVLIQSMGVALLDACDVFRSAW